MSKARFGACMPASCSRRASSARASLQASRRASRNRVAVEHREDQSAQRIELALPVGAIRSQHPLDQLAHHREPEWVGAPTRLLHGILEARLGKKDLGIVPGARAGIFVNSFLHQERRLPVDEIGQLSTHRGSTGAGGKIEKPQWIPPERPGRRALPRGFTRQTTPDQGNNFKG